MRVRVRVRVMVRVRVRVVVRVVVRRVGLEYLSGKGAMYASLTCLTW